MEIARAGPDRRVEARHRLHVVVEHVGFGLDDNLERAILAQEIGRQNFNRGAGRLCTNGGDGLGEMLSPAIIKVVTVYRGDDNMAQRQFCHSRADIFRFMRIKKVRPSGSHVAESASTGADRSEDHHGRMFLRPAFADVGTSRLLAHGDEVVLAHQRAGLGIFGRYRCLYAKPFRAARLRPVRITALFGMALGALACVDLRHACLSVLHIQRRCRTTGNRLSAP